MNSLMKNRSMIITEIISYCILSFFIGYCLAPKMVFFYTDICRIIIILLLLSLVFINYKSIKLNNRRKIPIILVMLLWGLLMLVLNGGTMNAFMSLSQFLFCIVVFSSINISKRQYIVTMMTIFVIWIVFVINAPTVWQKYITDVDAVYNPNTVGIGILLSYVIIFLFILKKLNKKILKFLLLVAFSAVSIYCVYITQCRSAFAISIVFPLFPLFKKYIFNFRLLLLIMIIIGGFIFPMVYVKMYESGINTKSTILLEKSMYTGRQELWGDALTHIDSSEFGWVLGVDDNSMDYTLTASNLHNWYLSIYFSFGIPFAIAYFAFYVFIFEKVKNIDISIALLLLSILGYVEVCVGARNISQIFVFVCFMLQAYSPTVSSGDCTGIKLLGESKK